MPNGRKENLLVWAKEQFADINDKYWLMWGAGVRLKLIKHKLTTYCKNNYAIKIVYSYYAPGSHVWSDLVKHVLSDSDS